MISKGLAYGYLSARRRVGEMILPIVTTATGAFLVVLVFGMSAGITAQSATLGHADEINRAVVLISVTVLLVGVVEVAVATTRTVAHRTRELGVLSANGIPRGPVVAAARRAGRGRNSGRRPGSDARCGRRHRDGAGRHGGHRHELRRAGPRSGDRHRGEHPGCDRHQHLSHVERGLASTYPISDSRRLVSV